MRIRATGKDQSNCPTFGHFTGRVLFLSRMHLHTVGSQRPESTNHAYLVCNETLSLTSSRPSMQCPLPVGGCHAMEVPQIRFPLFPSIFVRLVVFVTGRLTQKRILVRRLRVYRGREQPAKRQPHKKLMGTRENGFAELRWHGNLRQEWHCIDGRLMSAISFVTD